MDEAFSHPCSDLSNSEAGSPTRIMLDWDRINISGREKFAIINFALIKMPEILFYQLLIAAV